jgi:hypothetical protein
MLNWDEAIGVWRKFLNEELNNIFKFNDIDHVKVIEMGRSCRVHG